MRLICPNCGAQYEVPTEVIPEGGRDVQCSNCGHTWYQVHPDDDPELAQELGRPVPDEDWTPEPDPVPDTADEDVAPSDEGADAFDEDAEPADEDKDDRPDLDSAPEPDTRPQPIEARPRGLDPAVAEVLREEADREARQRAAESEALESQPDLGLEEPDEDEAARRSREARERMARMRGEPVEDAARERARKAAGSTGAVMAAAAAAGSRRELLPDIDEINQTLRASSERREVETPQGRAPVDEPARKGSFARGFLWVVLAAILAIALYVLAPNIAAAVPPLAPVLEAYVGFVDGLRLWLEQMVQGVAPAAPGSE